jgi:hypothetical protein
MALPVFENGLLYQRRMGSFIQRLQQYLAVSDEELAGVLEIPVARLASVFSGKEILNVAQFSRLSTKYQFSLEALDRGEVDLEALLQLRAGNAIHIPERYLIGARSRVRALRNIYHVVESIRGAEQAVLLLRRFQLGSDLFAEPERLVNVQLIEDALSFLRRHGVSSQAIRQMGTFSVREAQGSLFAEKMAQFSCPKEMYEGYLGDLVRLVEENNRYRLMNLSAHSCVVRSTENQDLLDLLKIRNAGGLNRCLYRQGALAAATRYLNLPDSDVKESSCVFRGDPCCEFEINFEFANLVQRK